MEKICICAMANAVSYSKCALLFHNIPTIHSSLHHKSYIGVQVSKAKFLHKHKLRSHAPSWLENFKFGTVEVLKLQPTNNDASSHAVKLQALRVDHAVVVKLILDVDLYMLGAPRLACVENAISSLGRQNLVS